MSARRRGDIEEMANFDAYISGKPLPIQLWLKFWRTVYYVVSVISYVLMITGVAFSFYYGIVHPSLFKAILAGLFTVLVIYVNKVNPS